MPPIVLYSLGGAVVGAVAGFFAGDGVSGASRIVKYAVIGAGVYVAAKALKVA